MRPAIRQWSLVLSKAFSSSPVVSFDDDILILVNEQDDAVGYLSKDAAHDGDGVLHRAFSVFLFNERGEVLLQQRAEQKRLWPGFWSNSCCSHPKKGEEITTAAHCRIQQELGVKADLQYLYKFVYQARFHDLGSEHELCWVYIGKCDQPVAPNALEVADHRWLAVDKLSAEIESSPDRFTPWMKQEWHQLTTRYRADCNSVCGVEFFG